MSSNIWILVIKIRVRSHSYDPALILDVTLDRKIFPHIMLSTNIQK
jgi:hypothetical protein